MKYLIPTELDFACEDTFGDRYRILGSCDGLFCICRDFEDLFLWNPSTRKLKELPSSGINVLRDSEGIDISYGFGYTECQSDYRVVEIVRNENSNRYNVSVYSLRTNSWKRIQEYLSIIFWDHSGKFVNGKLHWSAEDRVSDGNSTWFISLFNTADETFGNVALPNPNGSFFDCEIGSSGNLCLFCYEELKTDVWVMKEYDVAES
ncbi:F-box/kelch-repeat protein At3g23880-like [Nicotiana tabacum]|uniref:F-box/kelch-repeat protein At3g23880-like n=1 Tax=Nicotiana tabacum TaxID=4097 RepID=A0A1S4AB04_TOBAC|nr:PREDICTED: F-box/kelch-repeat protein At3g23880-like [Nicotiana tabacum]